MRRAGWKLAQALPHFPQNQMTTNKMPYIAVQTQRAVAAVSLLSAITLAVLAMYGILLVVI